MDRFANGDSVLGRVTSHLVSVKVTRAGIGGARGSRGDATAVELPGPQTRTNQGRLSWRAVVQDPDEQQACPVMGQELFLAETSWFEAQDIMTDMLGFGSEVGGGARRDRRRQTGRAPHQEKLW
ncbi:hypothetical protein QBC32DRAFT_367158 [Pseudoneurospora amorphoporcata]|uniref:Uncharacterized protein n=1 Tax=Pseudoneurospora amorphoporcata TaxID=241081 RepID=A0AAN6SJS5_9PEZI|nr:hypothetical protein QBC32DRAFT_367158 [Pseudoneurospora amorphoporcata]